MRILVTGGTGFIGAAVVDRAVAAGHEVTATSRHAGPVTSAGLRWVQTGELGPDTDWRSAVEGVDAVIHCAARAHVLREISADPLAEFRRINTAGTLRLARAAFAAGTGRFVFVSSAGVGGATSGAAPLRDADPPRPHSPYAVAKLEAERGLQALAGGQVTCVRPPLVFGPGAPGNLRRLLGLLARGIPLPLARIENQRSMVGRDSLADLLIRSATMPAAAGQTFYVADGAVSTPELVRILAAGLGVGPRLWPLPRRVLEWGGRLTGRRALVDQLCASLEVETGPVAFELGWRPADLRRGLHDMAHAYRQASG